MIRIRRLRSRARMVLNLVWSTMEKDGMSASRPPRGNHVILLLGALGGAGAGFAMNFLGSSLVDAASFGLAAGVAITKVVSTELRESSEGADAQGGGPPETGPFTTTREGELEDPVQTEGKTLGPLDGE